MLHLKQNTVDNDLQRNFNKLNCTGETRSKNDGSCQNSKSLPQDIASTLSMDSDSSSSSPRIHPQANTAPTASMNYYGFAYPYNYDPPNNFAYGNNNLIAVQATTIPRNSRFFPNQARYARSISPNSAPSSVEETVSKNSDDMRQRLSRSPQPVIPPRPVGYRNNTIQNVPGNMMYMPHFPVPTSSHPANHRTHAEGSEGGVCSPPPPTILESPENSASFHLQGADHPRKDHRPNDAPGKDVNSQLFVNIDSDDKSASHDWRPYQGHSPCNQPLVPQYPFQFNPSFSNYQPMFHLPDGNIDQQQGNLSPMPQPMYVPVPYPQMPYPTSNYYFPVPTSGQFLITNYEMNIQQHVYNQRHYLNALKFDLVKEKEETETHRKEIGELEKSLKENSFLPNKAEIDNLNMEISKLRLECYCLCAEVDEHYKGTVPLGEIDEDFYSCINTGQDGPLHSGRRKGHTEAEYPVTKSMTTAEEDEENEDASNWTCSACTFRNHPAISVCEVCQIGKNIACSS